MDDVHHFDDDDEKTLADKIYTSNSRSCMVYIPTCGSYLVMVIPVCSTQASPPNRKNMTSFE